MFKLSDRVKQTSTTTGTNDIVFASEIAGFQTFAQSVGDGNSTYYAIENHDRFEIGIGTYTSSTNTLSRDTVLISNNSNNKIILDGVSSVFVTYPASKSVNLDNSGFITGFDAEYAGIKFPDGTTQSTAGGGGTGQNYYVDEISLDSSNILTLGRVALADLTVDLSGLSSDIDIPESGNWNTAYDVLVEASGNWNTAYGWGDHSLAGYLTTISIPESGNWNTAYNTLVAQSGNWNTSYDTLVEQSGNWNTAYGWGDHSIVGYLTEISIPESGNWNTAYDTLVEQSGNWNTAYGWGDHSVEGYLTTINIPESGNWNTAYDTLVAQSGNWNTAYSWGDHSVEGYLTSFTEVNDLSAAVTWVTVPDLYISESSVVQHSGAMRITESQIVDLQTYLTAHPSITNNGSSNSNTGNTFIQNITLDSNGHVTNLSVGVSTVGEDAEGIASILEDTTPQLGGQLDANGYTIDMGNNIITDAKVGQWDTSYSTLVAQSGNWNTAYSWGDHSTEGYLTTIDIPESGNWNTAYDTLVAQSGNWNTAYSWGDHSVEGYLTEINIPESGNWNTAYDTLVAQSGNWNTSYDTLVAQSGSWNTAYSWGDHSVEGYLTTINIPESGNWNIAYNTLVEQSGNWNTAYSWGDHSVEGYLTAINIPESGNWNTAYDVLVEASGNWNTAYGWGDHSIAGYLTSFTETLTTLVADSGNQKLVYTDEDGSSNDVDLSWLVFTGLTGNGSSNYVARWTSSTTLGSGLIYDDLSGVGIGTTDPGVYRLRVVGGHSSFEGGNIQFDGGNVTVNQAGGNYDFRVEGDSQTHLLFTDASTDTVNVGSTNDSYAKLYLVDTQIDKSVSRGIGIFKNDYTTATDTLYAQGINVRSEKHVSSGITDSGYVIAGNFVALHDSDGTLNEVVGLRSNAGGYYSHSGVIENLISFKGVPVNLGGGTITNSYGLYLSSNPTSTNSYGVYQAGSNDTNYFAASVGIGTETPAHKLDVSGMARIVHTDGMCGLQIEDEGGSGIHLGDCAYLSGSTYTGMKHSAHTNSSEYMIISRGDHTYLSGKKDYGVIIRGGNNNPKCEIRVYDADVDGQNAVVINEGAYDRDTRIEGANEQNLFKVDASEDKIGIATSTPSSRLEVLGAGSTTDEGIITVNDPSSGGTTSWIKLHADDGFDDLTWHIAYGDTSMFRDLEFRTSFSAVPEVTIEPSSTLNLDSGGTSTKRFKAYDFYSTTYNTAALPAYTFANDLDTGMWLASANNLCFSTAGTERLRISSAGNVGINTSNPSYTLDIVGGARIEPTTSDGMLLGRSGGTRSIRATGADAPSEYLILDSNGNYLSLNHYTSDNVVMGIGGGNVGIATTAPTQKLHVQGNIKLSNGGVGTENDGVHMAFPGNGSDSNTTSVRTGYLKVQLPVGWTNTMISFDLYVYEYNTSGGAAVRKFRIGGYNHSGGGGQWIRPIAVYDGDGVVDHNLKVHFGYDGTYSAIYISKMSTAGVDSGAASSWSYPQAFVANVFGGYSATTMANWADDWDITFTTALGTISQTLEVNRSFKLNDSSYVFNDLGNNVDVRIESENLDYLIHTDASKDEVVIHNAVGYGLNYATSEGWIEGNGTQVGYYGGNFNRNGAATENFCEFGDLPNGLRGLIWKSRNNTTDNSADGGWTKNVTGVDPEKTYVSIVYVRRVGSSTTGNFYHGCRTGGADTLEMNGTSNGNPYFHAFNIAQLPQDVWCVSIGIIHAHSDPATTSTGIGGIYRLDTGVKTGSYTNKDYRMGPTATVQNQRTFLYYDTAGTSALDWCWPGFYEITADAVVSLFNTILYDPYLSGRDIVVNAHQDNYDFRVAGDNDSHLLFTDASTDRVGIGNTNPSEKLSVTILGSEIAGFHTTAMGPFPAVGALQSLKIKNVSSGITTEHWENLGTSATRTLQNLIRYDSDFISIDDAYTTGGFSTTFVSRLKINTTTGATTFNEEFTFPTTDGSANQVLVTDGAGSVTWQDQSGGGGSVGSVDPAMTQARITLQSGTPVTSSDITSSTIYYTPFRGNRIALYNGSEWAIHALTEISLNISSGVSGNTNYDLFVYDNSGTLTLEAVAWSSSTARATALATQDGVYVKSGDATRKYIGSFRTQVAPPLQTRDADDSRLVWNYYNRIKKRVRAQLTTSLAYYSWTYSSSAVRAIANNTTIGRGRFVIMNGVQEDSVDLTATCLVNGRSGSMTTTIGYDSNSTRTSTIAAGPYSASGAASPAGIANLVHTPNVGYHFYQQQEHRNYGGSYYIAYARNGTGYSHVGIEGEWTC